MTEAASEALLDLLVLHALRCLGLAPVEKLAVWTDADDSVTLERLRSLAESGHVLEREGAIAGWMLTPSGRAHHEQLLAAEIDNAGMRETIEKAYRDFLKRNDEVLAVCSAWQVRDESGEQVPNDHSDPDYDGALIDRVAALHGQLAPTLDALENALDRYRNYGPRLTAALEKLRAGDTGWLTSVRQDSYHTVWFQLHEDLLATLGISREQEAAHGG